MVPDLFHRNNITGFAFDPSTGYSDSTMDCFTIRENKANSRHIESMDNYITKRHNYTQIAQTDQSPSRGYFSPLSSPVLPLELSSIDNENVFLLTQQLALVEAQQSLLREQLIQEDLETAGKSIYRTDQALIQRQQEQHQEHQGSPLQYNVVNNSSNSSNSSSSSADHTQVYNCQHIYPASATPASLMNLDHRLHSTPTMTGAPIDMHLSDQPTPIEQHISYNRNHKLETVKNETHLSAKRTMSPRALKPLISPYLQPDQRNLQFLNAGEVPVMDHRRSAHKVAEQRRRDTLKQSFDELRGEIVELLVARSVHNLTEDIDQIRKEKEKEVKAMSKILIVQHSYEYITQLKAEVRENNERMRHMQTELQALRQRVAELERHRS
ncbi:hypothetical protein BCV72DRAFT_322982 [Rhizopus microsporus var. microsporus]|uniref:BHLH domain-containing protein n=1 Tax=Rhizopus microsporus var. microsporus TaxID=86635 RepID=A0A1X0QMY7_RHIZD|nr:hypothetical protein BCV72DRAFT_322982 [Rhizopus microsporus var. microsporus]